MKKAIYIIAAIVLLITVVILLGTDFSPKTAGIQKFLDTISATDFNEKLSKTSETDNNNLIVLDIRTADEFKAGHLKDAIYIDFYKSDFKEKLAALDKDKTYFMYCNSGNRTKTTMAYMSEMGFNKVYELKGGIQAWKALNLPITY